MPDGLSCAGCGYEMAEYIALESLLIEELKRAAADWSSSTEAVFAKTGEFHQSFVYTFRTQIECGLRPSHV
jgi:hypothetical protein